MRPECEKQVLEHLQAIRTDLADFGVGLARLHAEIESLATHVEAMRGMLQVTSSGAALRLVDSPPDYQRE
jgi:hypothetical protein